MESSQQNTQQPIVTPSHLYHYTNIDTLAMIVSSKKIRFKALTQVDDLNEGKAADFNTCGQYVFVSCWTDLEEESLPFWNMYTEKMKGVRIKMPANMFNDNIISTERLKGVKLGFQQSILNEEQSFHNDYVILPSHTNYLRKIIYTNEELLINPTIKQIIDLENGRISIDKIGSHKKPHWLFQSEWRFVLKCFPINLNEEHAFENTFPRLWHGFPIPITEIFADINPSMFEQMVITVGPKCTHADQIIVESLVEKYNQFARVELSVLRNQIR